MTFYLMSKSFYSVINFAMHLQIMSEKVFFLLSHLDFLMSNLILTPGLEFTLHALNFNISIYSIQNETKNYYQLINKN